MPRLTQRTRDARRAQILDAARRCFARTGFHATSMQDVFAEAGLSAGAVYSHFSGKDEIVAAIADDVIDRITATADALTGTPEPLADVLGRVFTALQAADIAPIAITVWGEAIHDPAYGGLLARRYRRMRDGFVPLVSAHQRRGTIDPDVAAEDVATLLTGMAQGFVCQLAFGADVDAIAYARGLSALVRVGR